MAYVEETQVSLGHISQIRHSMYAMVRINHKKRYELGAILRS